MGNYTAVVIGCGARAAGHIDAYRHLPDARVVACCAPSAVRREPLAARYGLRAYADAAVMLGRERPDIVHLITGVETRVPLMRLVSEHCVPMCTVEKPIAAAVGDWRELLELSRSTATRFAVCHQFRWQTHLMKCQAALQSGGLGPVRFLDISSGMNIAGQGTHTLNYGRSLIGDCKVSNVFASASGWSNDHFHPAPATTQAYLTFENGCRALWTSGPVSPRSGDPATVWQHVRVAAYAERGRVNYEEFGRWEIVGGSCEESGDFGGMETWRANNDLAQARFHAAMFRWHETGEEPGTSLAHSLHEWATVLAVYQSALERRPIAIEAFDPPVDLFDRLQEGLRR
jgi:predicted dehydrogenase